MPCACQGSDTKNPLEWQKNQQFMYLLHKGGFKSNQHEKSEDAVVPVLIKAPQSNTKHLEHKERSSGPFFKQLTKFRHIHLKSIARKQVCMINYWHLILQNTLGNLLACKYSCLLSLLAGLALMRKIFLSQMQTLWVWWETNVFTGYQTRYQSILLDYKRRHFSVETHDFISLRGCKAFLHNSS